ncbi:MAG: sensor histidine kinase [Hyphomonadaceae bacterium]
MKPAVNLLQSAAAAPAQRLIACALWAWLVAVIVVSLLAWLHGADAGSTGGAAALALAPAFLGFILLPRQGESWAQVALIAAWLIAATGATAGTGGALSPAVALYAAPMALGYCLGTRAPAVIAAWCAAGYVLAAALALGARQLALGPWPELMAATALLFSGGLLTLRAGARGPALPAAAALARVDAQGRVLAMTGEAATRLGVAAQSSDLFAALGAALAADERTALETMLTRAAAGTRGAALVRVNGRTLEIEAAPEEQGGLGALLLDIRDVSLWTQRTQATSDRVAEISHELRTPLTHILGFAEMMQTQVFGPLEDRYVAYATLIRNSGLHLLELINGLLDLSKIEAGRYELELASFDVRDIVRDVLAVSAGGAAPRQIALIEETPPAPLRVRADARAMRQMLLNTVGNAIKFSPDQGRVTLSARAENGRLVLDTIDTGPGIPAEERDRLGKRYERGAASEGIEGTGLGLALVRALADLHGGALSFHDAPGGGALVRLDLPVLADQGAAASD